MQQHKRSAPSEGTVPTTKKTRQLAADMPTPTTLEEASNIIGKFKREQAKLVDHIVKTDKDSFRKTMISHKLQSSKKKSC